MDVARAILDIVRRELAARKENSQDDTEKEQCHNHRFEEPNVFLCGHSAGAHLAALALSDPKYILNALAELKEESLEEDETLSNINISCIKDVLAGFVGISGVYNLRRLATSSLADVAIGPAFFGGKMDKLSRRDESLKRGAERKKDIISEASPVHVLLNAHASLSPDDTNRNSICHEGSKLSNDTAHIPLLATVPILLLNAESDFHLHHDATDLMVALSQFSEIQPNRNAELAKGMKNKAVAFEGGSLVKQNIEHRIISGTNHLSIMRRFGHDLLFGEEAVEEEEIKPQKVELTAKDTLSEGENQWTLSSLAMHSYDTLGYAASSVVSYLSGKNGQNTNETSIDETTERVLEFMSLHRRGVLQDHSSTR
eukprot:3184747-Ditylum_brightwellii.AAC.1